MNLFVGSHLAISSELRAERKLLAEREFASQKVKLRGYSSVRALGRYEGGLKDIVLALKAGNTRMAKPLAKLLVELVDLTETVDLVTWVPASKAGFRSRGFDQSQLLAKHLSKRLGVKCSRTVRRIDNYSQHDLSRAGRGIGPSFRLLRPIQGRVLVVDDVITTGMTLERYRRLLDPQNQSILSAVCLASAN